MEKKQTEKNLKEINISLPEKLFRCLFSIFALIVIAVGQILLHFNVCTGSIAFSGIICILSYSLAIIGVVWNLIKTKNFSVEFIFSLVILFLVIYVW